VKYDWFVGYAKEKEGDGKIAVSVLVAHEKYIGIRAAQYAMMAFKKYFINYFDNKIESTMKRTQAF
jgi:cell division protein FtsI/penicillin-binding protein 2